MTIPNDLTPYDSDAPAAARPSEPGTASSAVQRPLRVLYLAGIGRSGSTLLERILGEVPGICSLGEVVFL
ncbi:MAG TPA: hypothetical protein VIH08_13030, partial [Blastococcus sp.]